MKKLSYKYQRAKSEKQPLHFLRVPCLYTQKTFRIFWVYILAVTSLVFPLATFAANDVSLQDGSIISVGGYSLTISGSQSSDQITVGSDSFDDVLSNGSS